jgi:hypothetical protein
MNVSSSTLTTSHSIALSPLIADTVYFYNVSSTTKYNMNATSIVYNFTTASAVGGSSPSSSGGGGGGSSSARVTFVELSGSYKGGDFSKNDILEFEYKNKTYQINIKTIGKDYVNLLVTSTGQLLRFGVKEEKKVDLDNDNRGDVQIEVTLIDRNKADIMIRELESLKPLQIIKLPKPKPVTEDLTPVAQPVIEPEEPVDDKRELIPYSMAVITALALVGGLVMKEKMRVDYISQQHELMLPKFIHKAKKKGHKLEDIRNTLIKKGWPAHTVDSASLHGAITLLQKQGHNHSAIRNTLKKKGFSTKIVNDAIVTHHINKELRKRRSIKKIRKDLLDAGWDNKVVHKKLPPKHKK